MGALQLSRQTGGLIMVASNRAELDRHLLVHWEATSWQDVPPYVAVT
jgi:hypothetical protein